MNILKKIVGSALLVIALCLIAAAVYVQLQGKEIMMDVMAKSVGRAVTIDKVSYRFPFGLSLENFSIEPVLRAESVKAQVDPRSLWGRNIQFSSVKLDNCKFFWKNDAIQAAAPEPGASSTQDKPAREVISQKQNLIIHNLSVSNGLITYYQDAPHAETLNIIKDFSFELRDVQLKVHNLVFPSNQPVFTKFDLQAKLLKEGLPISGSSVETSGWVNWGRKDMEAQMRLQDEDGKAGLEAKAVSNNNDLQVKGKVSINNFLLGVGGEEAKPGDVQDLILGALSSSGLDIAANFSFQTLMDSFQIENVSFSGSVETPEEIFKVTQ